MKKRQQEGVKIDEVYCFVIKGKLEVDFHVGKRQTKIVKINRQLPILKESSIAKGLDTRWSEGYANGGG